MTDNEQITLWLDQLKGCRAWNRPVRWQELHLAIQMIHNRDAEILRLQDRQVPVVVGLDMAQRDSWTPAATPPDGAEYLSVPAMIQADPEAAVPIPPRLSWTQFGKLHKGKSSTEIGKLWKTYKAASAPSA